MALPIKYIVEYGTNLPPSYFAEPLNRPQWLDAPLDGVVIDIFRNDGIEASTHTAVSTPLTTASDLTDALRDLKSTNLQGWGPLRYNFIKIQISSPVNVIVDWFDPANKFAQNTSVLGELGAAADVYGIAFDSESYIAIWDYTLQPQKLLHTFAEYEVKVKEAARTVMTRWLAANSNAQVLVFISYMAYVDGGGAPENRQYGLFKAWLDEWHDVMGEFVQASQEGCRTNCSCLPNNSPSKAKLILTNETGYFCTSNACINEIVTKTNGDAGAAYKGGSVYFPSVDLFGGTLWLTAPVFNNTTPSLSYFSPDTMKAVIKMWANYGVDMFWVYTDPTATWFGPTGPTLNQDYIDRMRELREELGLP